jgi:Leucine-rich repeat (LRR) protein
MAHGPETDELMERIATMEDNTLDVGWLDITSLPDLPADLCVLICSGTRITSLPTLPASLLVLHCDQTPITELPELPPRLEQLYCYKTAITTLPDLPATLEVLWCYSIPITVLPDLPELLQLYCMDTPLLLQKGEYEPIEQYALRWRVWREEELVSKKRMQERARKLKEDLVAEVWSPRRVENLLENYGFDVIEGM